MKLILNKEVNAWVRREDIYRQNKSTMYSVTYGQCTEPLRTKLRGLADFEAEDKKADVVWLLNAIREASYEFEAQHYPVMSVHAALRKFYGQYQREGQSNESYLQSF